jgi:hypothetical protein
MSIDIPKKRHDSPTRYNAFNEFKYYGNYAGPNYSAGRYSSSYTNRKQNIDDLISGKTIDQLDEAAKEHDMYYTLGKAKEGDDILISESSKLYTIPDLFRFFSNNWSPVRVLSGKHMKDSAIALNLGFRAKRLVEKVRHINSPVKNKHLTKEQENKIETILRKKDFGRRLKIGTTSRETI